MLQFLTKNAKYDTIIKKNLKYIHMSRNAPRSALSARKNINSRNSRNTKLRISQKKINALRSRKKYEKPRNRIKLRSRQALENDPKMRIPNRMVKTKTSVNDILNLENKNFETNNRMSSDVRNLATMILAEAGGE